MDYHGENAFLIAFDPLTGETLWSVPRVNGWNGGVLATAGGLVFQGTGSGFVAAHHADTGETLWQHNTYSAIVAPPVSYEIDGTQYVAILTGSGGSATHTYGSASRLVVYKLGGTGVIPEPPKKDWTIPEQPPLTASAEDLDRGDVLYHNICTFCHGRGVDSNGGALPDLRLMSAETHAAFQAIVRGGTLADNGMASFADLLSAEDANRVHQYIISRATMARAAQSGGD